MAQTTGAASWVNALIETKVGVGAYADMGGSTNKLEASGHDRITGKAFTQVGGTPIITSGKLDEGEVKLSILYTENASEAWKVLYDAYLAGSLVYFRWTPKGAGYVFTTAGGYLKNVTAPAGESASGDPIMCEATLVCSGKTQT